MLIRMMPKDHTSVAQGLYTGATLFLHSVNESAVISHGKRNKVDNIP